MPMNYILKCPSCGLIIECMAGEDDETKKRILFNENGTHKMKFATCRCGNKFELNEKTRTIQY